MTAVSLEIAREWFERNQVEAGMGLIAFMATAYVARQWVREAKTSGGTVTANEWMGISARAALMATGSLALEQSLLDDPFTGISSAALVAMEVKLISQMAKDAPKLKPRNFNDLLSGRYWGDALKLGLEGVGALLVVPKLGIALWVMNPMATTEGTLGTAAIMIANYDKTIEWLEENKVINQTNRK